MNPQYNGKQEVAKNWGTKNLDQSAYLLSNTFTEKYTRKYHIRIDNASSNFTLPTVSKNNKRSNPRPTTRNYEHKQINFILPKKSLPVISVNRTSIIQNLHLPNHNNHSTASKYQLANCKSTELSGGGGIITTFTPVL